MDKVRDTSGGWEGDRYRKTNRYVICYLGGGDTPRSNGSGKEIGGDNVLRSGDTEFVTFIVN